MRCCINTGKLGCYLCSEANIDTKLLATQTGVHKIEVIFANITLTQDANITLGNPIIFANKFNECYSFTLKIKNPDGSDFTDSGADCWTFRIDIDSAV